MVSPIAFGLQRDEGGVLASVPLQIACLTIPELIGERKTAIHFVPEQLTSFCCHRKGAVVQISGEIAEGIADASPILWGERFGGVVHRLILLSVGSRHADCINEWPRLQAINRV